MNGSGNGSGNYSLLCTESTLKRVLFRLFYKKGVEFMFKRLNCEYLGRKDNFVS